MNPMEVNIKPYAMNCQSSQGRVFDEPEHAFRTIFQRDRDRILHSTAFRRLEYKTQVFVNHEGDFYRTRLTHTLEVSQISRTISRYLGLNEDLTEAIALAHDLGHTPFGHAGENALNELMEDSGGFEHNLQGLRVVDLLESRYDNFPGLNLSHELRESFVKHHTPFDNPHTPEEFKKCGNPLLEVQATIIADEIAYDNHDIDDGLYSGIIQEDELHDLAIWRKATEKFAEAYKKMPIHIKRAEGVRSLINLLVCDVIENSQKNISKFNLNSLEDVRNCDHPVICQSPTIARDKLQLENFLKEKFYLNHRVTRMAEKCKRFLREMFLTFCDDPRTLPEKHQKRIHTECTERVVADYIAGMTDRYAEQEYQKLFQPFMKT